MTLKHTLLDVCFTGASFRSNYRSVTGRNNRAIIFPGVSVILSTPIKVNMLMPLSSMHVVENNDSTLKMCLVATATRLCKVRFVL